MAGSAARRAPRDLDRQRRAAARRHDRLRGILKDDRKRIGAGDAPQHRLHGIPVARSVADQLRQQLRHHFRVGLRAEAVAVRANQILKVGSNREVVRLPRPQTVMIDATYLKAHRTATSLWWKKGDQTTSGAA